MGSLKSCAYPTWLRDILGGRQKKCKDQLLSSREIKIGNLKRHLFEAHFIAYYFHILNYRPNFLLETKFNY